MNVRALIFIFSIFFSIQARASDDAVSIVLKLYKDFSWETVIVDPDLTGLIDQPRDVLQRYFDEKLTGVVFPNESSAQQFNDYFDRLGYQVISERADVLPELPWDVVVVKHMAPTHAEISQFEATLQAVASSFGGRNDGWGCFEQ